MITALEIRNFKRFTRASFDLGRLTVLSGLNGAGKSTVIQSLLLARQISELQSGNTIQLNGPYGLALGEAQELLRLDAEGSSIELILRSGAQQRHYRMSVPDERALYVLLENVFESPLPELTRHGFGFTYLGAERLGPRDQLDVSAADIARIGVGHQGEFTAQVLAMNATRQVPEAVQHPATNEQYAVTTLRTHVEGWVGDIVRPLRIDAQWPSGLTASTIRFREPGVFSEPIRPTNMGFGVSYALPVIVAGLLAEPGGMLIVENPEAHLHPAGQSRIGRFLGRVAGAGVQVLVETHSDHVLNGVRIAAAEEGTVPAEEVAMLFFGGEADANAAADANTPADEGAPAAVRIGLKDDGQVAAWPAGFFDQLEHDLGRLARARRRRR
ncbi:DUF3696 domain-containing protein [Streptomonospora litoralis]|uniref:DUF3696 domain-containing protein n=1 Tax=Streptomonospora litoralis TaxID=2498135 RepID=A0A4P6QAC5_9ACTN|nr:DUF3696 domain-containing protein [Streptomonospora litoralis]QBI56459.1 hypothetical protein EKD16_23560 [Streptomonospora litoralis]